jgi:beta-lactamase class A
MLKGLQRFLTLLLLLAGASYLLYQALLYSRARDLMPPGTTVAGLNVSGLSAQETAELIARRYTAPIIVYHQQERIELNPGDLGFALDVEGMVRQAAERDADEEYWQGFAEFLLGRSLAPITVDLVAAVDEAAVRERIHLLASLLDQPAKAPQLLGVGESFQEGEAGFVTNVEASVPEVAAALLRPDNRQAHLIIEDQPAPPFDINMLADAINRQLDTFDGLGIVFILDLQTGEEVSINGDVAISGLSILKIAIFVEAYLALDGPPTPEQEQIILETAVQSSNYGANLLLHVVAGENNTYRGADILTESLHRLGLINTFMAVPYDAVAPAHRQVTYVTPANSRPDPLTTPDPSRQTTAEEIGTLLSMIYYCAKGGGALLAVYPGKITPQECQAILDVMVLNYEGNLIRLGVPRDVPVSHKHGWDGTTYGDAGIVFSPGGDYVIVEYVTLPTNNWLIYDFVYPTLGEISRTVYNYFNFDQPNRQTAESRAEEDQAILDAAAAAAEAEEAATPDEETTPDEENTPDGADSAQPPP